MPGDDDRKPDLAIRHHGGVVIARIKVQNLMGALEVRRISEQLGQLIDEGCLKLILDLKYARLFGSAALGMVIELAQRLQARGGKLVLSHPEHIMPVLKVSRVDKLIATAPDPKAAIELFG